MIAIAMAVEDKTLWTEVHSCLQGEPVLVDFKQPRPVDLKAFIGTIARSRPDMVLIDLSVTSALPRDGIRQIRLATPGAWIIGLQTADDTSQREPLPDGADEYLVSPLAGGLKKAVDRRQSEFAKLDLDKPRGRSVSFLSSKGGCGATTLACHVAVELSRLKQTVLLADLDFHNGLVALLLKSKSPYSIADALHDVERLDASYWKALVSNGIPDLDVISAPKPVPAQLAPRPEVVRQVLGFASRQYQWTVTDAGSGLNSHTRSVLESADEVCLVSTAEILALHQTKEILQNLLHSGFRPERLRLVLNRVPKHSGVRPEELQNLLGIPVYAVLPDAYPELHDAISQGELLSPETELGRNMGRLARKLAGVVEPKTKRKFFG